MTNILVFLAIVAGAVVLSEVVVARGRRAASRLDDRARRFLRDDAANRWTR